MGDINSFGEVENLLQPFFYSSVTPLPEVPPGSSPVLNSNTTKGFISEDCLLACFYNKGVIQCFSVDTKLSDTHYTPKSHVPICVPETPYSFPPRCVITCSSEFMHNQRASRGVRKILLGLNCTGAAAHYNLGGGNGALAIYDPIQRQVVKWISVPYPVTTVRVVSHFEREDAVKPFYNGAMMAMVGIAAVGMVGGEVLIIDLGLDRTDFLPPTGVVLCSSLTPQPQSKPFRPLLVDPFDRLIAMKRHNAINKNRLICLSTLDNDQHEDEENTFIYTRPSGAEIARFNHQDVSITALEYISNIGCLLVGFSFGGFQIWRVDDLTLQYSSDDDTQLPVLSFGFQQPIDDPKNFCYIWVLYGAQNLQQTHSHLDLYQLFFLEKSHIDSFGYIYQNMQRCAKTLLINLEDVYLPRNSEDSDDDDDGVPTEARSDKFLVHPMRLWIMDELVFISWSVVRPGVLYVGIFDLNQWYSSHTSDSVPTGDLCSFWVTIPVERPGSYGIPWDFRLVPSSLVRWENTYKQQDIHQYPASITFQGTCLTSDGIFGFEHFGLQEKILRFILRDGHTVMSEPVHLRYICHTYGLQPVTTSIYEPETLNVKDIDRFYIFTMLLESKRPALIVKMANIWLDGSYANVGCTIDLIINWVRNLALSVRYLAEEHWQNTLNAQADNLLPETKKFISYSSFIWNNLHSLLETLCRHDEVYNVSRIPALDDLKLSLERLVQYSATILLFCQAGILPSRDDTIDQLIEFYESRRRDVRKALNNCDIVPEDMKPDHPCLVIDQMLSNFGEDFVRREWNLEPTELLYPPRHVGYVVNMLMWRDVDRSLIYRVMFYFIIDFMKATGSFSSEVKGDFLSVIHMSPEEREELFNLWKVDHGYLQQPMSYLCQSQKFYSRNTFGKAWSTAVTILTALGATHNMTDLYRSGCPPFLGKLYINLMAQSREKFECLMDEVCSAYSVVLADSELIQYFFQVSSQKGYLEDFINTKIKHSPESILSELVSFLEKTSNFDNQRLLVMYYIKSDNYEKAHQVHRNMILFWGHQGLLLNSMQKTIWSSQQEMMEKLPVKKPESTIQNFLKMKGTCTKVAQPVQTVTIKPMRIMELCEPAMNFEKIQRPLNFMTQYQMSPLRRYIPQTVVLSKSPSNIEASSQDLVNEDTVGDTVAASEPRRSISFDVESVLKTPTVDHRNKRRLRNTPDSSKTNNSLYETPLHGDEVVHSILKKGEGSVKCKVSLKTRFLDPASGEEFASPEVCMDIDANSDILSEDGDNDGPADEIVSPYVASGDNNVAELLLEDEDGGGPTTSAVELKKTVSPCTSSGFDGNKFESSQTEIVEPPEVDEFQIINVSSSSDYHDPEPQSLSEEDHNISIATPTQVTPEKSIPNVESDGDVGSENSAENTPLKSTQSREAIGEEFSTPDGNNIENNLDEAVLLTPSDSENPSVYSVQPSVLGDGDEVAYKETESSVENTQNLRLTQSPEAVMEEFSNQDGNNIEDNLDEAVLLTPSDNGTPSMYSVRPSVSCDVDEVAYQEGESSQEEIVTPREGAGESCSRKLFSNDAHDMDLVTSDEEDQNSSAYIPPSSVANTEREEALEKISPTADDNSEREEESSVSFRRAFLRSKVVATSLEELSMKFTTTIPDENMNENHTEASLVERNGGGDIVLSFIASDNDLTEMTTNRPEADESQIVNISSSSDDGDSKLQHKKDPNSPPSSVTRSTRRQVTTKKTIFLRVERNGNGRSLNKFEPLTKSKVVQEDLTTSANEIIVKNDDEVVTLNSSNDDNGSPVHDAVNTKVRSSVARDRSDNEEVDKKAHTEEFTPLITRSSLRSRSKSVSPARVLPEEPPPRRKTKAALRVFDYAPDLTTVMETTGDTSHMLEKSDRMDQSDESDVMVSRTRKRRRTRANSHVNDDDDCISDISMTSTTPSSKRGRRSMTATPTTTPDKVTTRSNRKSMTPTTSPDKVTTRMSRRQSLEPK